MWQRRVEFRLFAPVALAFRHSHPALARLESPQMPQLAEHQRPRAQQMMRFLDQELASRRFIAADDFTIADITAIVAMDLTKLARVEIPQDLPHLTRWRAEVSARPSVVRLNDTTACSGRKLDEITARIRACRFCAETPEGAKLPHEPRPVLRVSTTARLLLASQAPGNLVNQTGIPFNDPSGDRLRDWMGVDRDTFYDVSRIAIVPMGFCFPGNDAAGGDLPPRPECRARWHDSLFATLPQIETVVAIGRYAQDYHFARLGNALPRGASVSNIVARWREFQQRAAADLSPAPSVLAQQRLAEAQSLV